MSETLTMITDSTIDHAMLLHLKEIFNDTSVLVILTILIKFIA